MPLVRARVAVVAPSCEGLIQRGGGRDIDGKREKECARDKGREGGGEDVSVWMLPASFDVATYIPTSKLIIECGH